MIEIIGQLLCCALVALSCYFLTPLPLPKSSSKKEKHSPNHHHDHQDNHHEDHQIDFKKYIKREHEHHNMIEILPYLFLGDRYSIYDLCENINPHQITCVINVADDFVSPPFNKNLFQYHIPMNDEYEPKFLEHLVQVQNIIVSLQQDAETFNEKILIHCKYGLNRSVSMIAGFLLYEGYCHSLPDALSFIHKKVLKARPHSSKSKAIRPRLQYLKALTKLEKDLPHYKKTREQKTK